MPQNIAETLYYLGPELVIATLLALAMLVSGLKAFRQASGMLIYISVIALAGLAIWFVIQAQADIHFHNEYIHITKSTQAIKSLFMLIAATALVQLSIDPDTFDPRDWPVVILSLLFNLLALCLWTSSTHLLLFVISLELISITAYLLATILAVDRPTAVSLKYLLFGAFSLALLLYGYSLLVPFFGNPLHMHTFGQLSKNLEGLRVGILLPVGLSLFACGILFKAALFPMHIWAPAIYEVQRPSMLTYLSVAPKIAALAVLFQLSELFGYHFQIILIAICILTILFASVAALRENNLKRLFAYSSIAHAGFMLVNVVQPTSQSLQYLFLYMLGYWMMNTAFTTYMQMAGDSIVKMNDFSGVARRNPKSSLLFTWTIVAMIGLPPTGGFTIKFFTFLGLWGKAGLLDIRWVYLLLFTGLGAIVLSFFYYFKIPYRMYFKKLTYESPPVFKAPVNLFFMMMASVLLLFLFFMPFEILKIFNLYNL